MAEGAFPARRLEDSLLHDDERAVANGELWLRTESVHDFHRQRLPRMRVLDAATSASAAALFVVTPTTRR